MLKQHIKVISYIFTLVSIIVGAYLHVDSRYAYASNVEKLEKRMLMNELNQAYRDTRKEMYELRELVRKYPTDQKLQQQLNEVEDDYKRLGIELKNQ